MTINTDDFIALKVKLKDVVKQVTIDNGKGWALVKGDEVVAFWKVDARGMRNTCMARVG